MGLTKREEQILSDLERQFDVPGRQRRRWRRFLNPRLPRTRTTMLIFAAGVFLAALLLLVVTATLSTTGRGRAAHRNSQPRVDTALPNTPHMFA